MEPSYSPCVGVEGQSKYPYEHIERSRTLYYHHISYTSCIMCNIKSHVIYNYRIGSLLEQY